MSREREIIHTSRMTLIHDVLLLLIIETKLNLRDLHCLGIDSPYHSNLKICVTDKLTGVLT